ncbi:YslB family protein [Listeria sp. PSOL-1]|uniref:YslB family protein n=1 Tax=Listeria sp. PSOL-1 TaxID=1844999 RepID=UPI0013D09D1D|nr:YslB family protein [Listeria sp. PSOL-1]
MTDKIENNDVEQMELELVPSFAHELYRDYLLPELLGEEAPHILYWAGKDLARQFPLETFDEVVAFFKKASFGDLEIMKDKKDELHIRLFGNQISGRFEKQNSPTFKLEAGFIAESLQSQKKLYTEAYDEINSRKKEAVLIVKWDRKETIE